MKGYCIHTDTRCTPLSNTYIGKDKVNYKCLNDGVANSVECGGFYCLDVDSKCKSIDGSVNYDKTINIIGKDKTTDICIGI